MKAEEAIERARAAHKSQGCVCSAPIVAVLRHDKIEGRGADRENFDVSLEHEDWCPLYRSLLERRG